MKRDTPPAQDKKRQHCFHNSMEGGLVLLGTFQRLAENRRRILMVIDRYDVAYICSTTPSCSASSPP